MAHPGTRGPQDGAEEPRTNAPPSLPLEGQRPIVRDAERVGHAVVRDRDAGDVVANRCLSDSLRGQGRAVHCGAVAPAQVDGRGRVAPAAADAAQQIAGALVRVVAVGPGQEHFLPM